MFKLQSPSKYSPFDAIHLLRRFFHCSKQFLNSSILMPFSTSAIFVSCLPLQQNVPLWGLFFIQGNKKNVTRSETGWIGRVGQGGHAIFHQKLLNTQCSVGRCIHNSPTIKWANALSLQKKFAEAKPSLSQHHQLVHWYGWVPRMLT